MVMGTASGFAVPLLFQLYYDTYFQRIDMKESNIQPIKYEVQAGSTLHVKSLVGVLLTTFASGQFDEGT